MKKFSAPHRTLAVLAASAVGVSTLAAGGIASALPTADVGQASVSSSSTAPAATNVRAADATASSVTVAWDGPAGATQFRLDYADNPAMDGFRKKWTSNERFTLRDLEAGTSYWVRVRTTGMNGSQVYGDFSEVVEVSTGAVGAPQQPTQQPTQQPSPEPTQEPAPEPTPEPTTDPAPTGKSLFGANYTTRSEVDERVYEDRARAARIFFQQLDSTQFSRNGAVKEALADGISTFVISWKETDREAIKRFLAGIPDDLTVYTSFNHEPENDEGGPGSASYKAWSEEYKRQWSLQAPLMRAEGMIPTNILMGWTLDPKSGRDVADWTPPKGTFDVFAFDAYYGKGKDPATLVSRMEAAAKAAGVNRTGLAETGAPTSDPSRVQNTKEMRAAIIDSGMFEWGLYWNSAEGGYDSRMDKATADAWFG